MSAGLARYPKSIAMACPIALWNQLKLMLNEQSWIEKDGTADLGPDVSGPVTHKLVNVLAATEAAAAVATGQVTPVSEDYTEAQIKAAVGMLDVVVTDRPADPLPALLEETGLVRVLTEQLEAKEHRHG